MSREFDSMLLKIGIKRELSCAHTPLQNGVSERRNRHLVESCRAQAKGVPRIYWGECIRTAAYLHKKTPSSAISNKTLYEMLHKKVPDVGHLQVFGCVCYVHLPEPSKGKLDKKAVKCVFVGYSTERKGWRCIEPSTRRVYESRDVVFDEGTSWGGFAAERGDVHKPATTV